MTSQIARGLYQMQMTSQHSSPGSTQSPDRSEARAELVLVMLKLMKQVYKCNLNHIKIIRKLKERAVLDTGKLSSEYIKSKFDLSEHSVENLLKFSEVLIALLSNEATSLVQIEETLEGFKSEPKYQEQMEEWKLNETRLLKSIEDYEQRLVKTEQVRDAALTGEKAAQLRASIVEQERDAAIARSQEQERELAALRTLLGSQPLSSNIQEDRREVQAREEDRLSSSGEAAVPKTESATERKRILVSDSPDRTGALSSSSSLLSAAHAAKKSKKDEKPKDTDTVLKTDGTFSSSKPMK